PLPSRRGGGGMGRARPDPAPAPPSRAAGRDRRGLRGPLRRGGARPRDAAAPPHPRHGRPRPRAHVRPSLRRAAPDRRRRARGVPSLPLHARGRDRRGNERTNATASTNHPIAKAITAGLRDAMTADDRVLLMGEDIGTLGGVFRVTDGLHAEFGSQRVVDTPLAEAGIVGTAVGLAVRGYRPVVEIQFDGFVFPAFNQITTQVAKMHNRTSGRVNMPLVIRIPHGGGIGAVEHHSESPETYFAHTAGLRILAPATAHDAYWLTRQAIESEDPVIMLEPRRRYWVMGDVDPDRRPELSPWQARVVRPGTDATLLAWGPSMPLALESAQVAAEDGIDLEVI